MTIAAPTLLTDLIVLEIVLSISTNVVCVVVMVLGKQVGCVVI
jgi:hypothetical protein